MQFFSLYGHLARSSLTDLSVGAPVARGQRIGWIGGPAENGGWPPHVHFQLMVDMLGMRGDYPGACAPHEWQHWRRMCPNPDLVLRLRAFMPSVQNEHRP